MTIPTNFVSANKANVLISDPGHGGGGGNLVPAFIIQEIFLCNRFPSLCAVKSGTSSYNGTVIR